MKVITKAVKAIFISVGIFFLSVMLFVWAGLAWIAYRPLPHIPHYSVQYSLKDAGPVGTQNSIYPGYSSPDGSERLTSSGGIVPQDAAEAASDKAHRDAEAARLAGRLGLPQSSYVCAVSPIGHALVFQGDALWLWRNGGFVLPIPRKARGYSWKIYSGQFHVLDVQDTTVENGRIATAGASSGGMSSPHGRSMPLVWRPGQGRPEDLNSAIDPASGWYLDMAVDINGRGQILCIARQTDEKGAESYDKDDAHWLVLTPL